MQCLILGVMGCYQFACLARESQQLRGGQFWGFTTVDDPEYG